MKQSFFNFILFFKRIEEVKIIRARASRLKVNVDKLDVLSDMDVKNLSDMFRVTSDLKTFYFLKPAKKHVDISSNLQGTKMSMMEKQGQIRNADEAQYLQELFKAVSDYERLDEMFEQNSFFWLFIGLSIICIASPIIFTLAIK